MRSAGDGEPGQDVGDRPPVVTRRRGRGRRGCCSRRWTRSRSRWTRPRSRSTKCPARPLRPGEIAGVGEDVPPHLARVVGDLLRIEGPDRADLGAGVHRGGEGVVRGLVTGEQDRARCREDRGDRQPGRLAGTRGHDRDDHVLPGRADLRTTGVEGAEQDAAVSGQDLFYSPGRPGSGAGSSPWRRSPCPAAAPGPPCGRGRTWTRHASASTAPAAVTTRATVNRPGTTRAPTISMLVLKAGHSTSGCSSASVTRKGAHVPLPTKVVGEISGQPGQGAEGHGGAEDAEQEVEERVRPGGGRGRAGARGRHGGSLGVRAGRGGARSALVQLMGVLLDV